MISSASLSPQRQILAPKSTNLLCPQNAADLTEHSQTSENLVKVTSGYRLVDHAANSDRPNLAVVHHVKKRKLDLVDSEHSSHVQHISKYKRTNEPSHGAPDHTTSTTFKRPSQAPDIASTAILVEPVDAPAIVDVDQRPHSQLRSPFNDPQAPVQAHLEFAPSQSSFSSLVDYDAMYPSQRQSDHGHFTPPQVSNEFSPAEALRLRLRMAMFKIKTNQICVPMSELKLSVPSETTHRIAARSRTVEPSPNGNKIDRLLDKLLDSPKYSVPHAEHRPSRRFLPLSESFEGPPNVDFERTSVRGLSAYSCGVDKSQKPTTPVILRRRWSETGCGAGTNECISPQSGLTSSAVKDCAAGHLLDLLSGK